MLATTFETEFSLIERLHDGLPVRGTVAPRVVIAAS